MTETNVTQSEYVTAADVARTLGVTRQTVYRMCQNGRLAYVMTGATGKIYRISRQSLSEHLAEAHRGPAPAPSWAWQHPGQTEIPE